MNFPPIYSFPPSYTRQPNAIIRNKQIVSWIDIVLQNSEQQKYWEINSLGKFKKVNVMDSVDETEPIFCNTEINRTVPPLFIKEIFQQMLSNGQLIRKKINQQKEDKIDEFYILWKNVDSWASQILEWFETCNKLNQVVTIYELTDGDESIDWQFHSMPDALIINCLSILVKRGRATMLKDEFDKYIAIKVI